MTHGYRSYDTGVPRLTRLPMRHTYRWFGKNRSEPGTVRGLRQKLGLHQLVGALEADPHDGADFANSELLGSERLGKFGRMNEGFAF